MTRQPPRMATWLFQRLASGPNLDSLAGDLVEQYREGRSGAWYWRQVLSAIAAGVARDIRGHKLLAFRALTIGWLLYWLSSIPVNELSFAIRARLTYWLMANGHDSFWATYWSAHLPSTLLVYSACAAGGWLVGRLHRPHSAAMVTLFAVSVLVFEYGMISLLFVTQPRPSWVEVPQAALVLPAVLAIGRPVSALIGGFSAVAPRDHLHSRT